MTTLPEVLKLDDDNIWYIDSSGVNILPLNLEYPNYKFTPKSRFYKIEGMNDYIIKIDDDFILFEELRIKKMLKKIYELKDRLPNIDLPIAYYKENGKMKGTIVKYYPNALSLRKIIKAYSANKLLANYHHGNTLEETLVSLYLEILNLLFMMYREKMFYTDIHGGNFLIYNNEVKIIDFDPRYVSFYSNELKKRKMIKKYCTLVNNLNISFDITNSFLFPENNFESMEEKVKMLIKK